MSAGVVAFISWPTSSSVGSPWVYVDSTVCLTAFRRAQLQQDERLDRSRAEHEAIMQAIAEGDGDMASRRMRAHMLNAATALRRFIEASKPV